MRLAFVGTGYRGLVTGTCRAELGHTFITGKADVRYLYAIAEIANFCQLSGVNSDSVKTAPRALPILGSRRRKIIQPSHPTT